MKKPNDLQAAFEANEIEVYGFAPDLKDDDILLRLEAFQAGAAYGKTQERERIIADIESDATRNIIVNMIEQCTDNFYGEEGDSETAAIESQTAIVNKLKGGE